MSKEDVLHILEEEDIASILHRIEISDAQNVILFVPEHADFLSSAQNLQLARDKAAGLNKTIFLLTSDKLGQTFASVLGVSLMGTISPGIAEKNIAEKIASADNKKIGRETKSSSHPIPVHKQEAHPVISSNAKNIESHKERTLKKFLGIFQNHSESVVSLDSDSDIQGQHKVIVSTSAEESSDVVEFEPENLDAEKSFPSLKRVVKDSETHLKRMVVFSLAGVILLVLIFIGLFVLPEATLDIQRKTSPLQLTFAVQADSTKNGTDLSTNTIPAQLIQIKKDVSQDYPVTSQQNLVAKAHGTIAVYNNYNSNPQILVVNTRFVSDNGKIFRLTKTITVPGATMDNGAIVPHSINAQVVADQPGSDYNIGPSKFSIPGFMGSPKYQGFYGQSTDAMSGGANGTVHVVTKDFLNNSINQLQDEALKLAQTDLQNRIPPSFTLLEGAYRGRVISADSNLGVGGVGDTLHVTLHVEYDAIVFSSSDLRTLGLNLLQKNSATDQEIVMSTFAVTPSIGSTDFDNGKMQIQLIAQALTAKQIDVESLRHQIVGLGADDVKNIVSQNDAISGARLILWPFWVSSVPTNLQRITINIQPQ